MKKFAIAISFIALVAGPALGAPLLRLDKPNGGETLVPGSTYEICWTATGITQNVKLILLQNGAPVGVIAESLAPGSSPRRWPVGKYSGGSVTSGGGYAIRIKTLDGSLLDVSDGTFTIGSPDAAAALKVTFPVGNEPLAWGTLQSFRWSASGINGGVKVTLLRNNSPAYELSPSVPATAGAVGWTVGDAPGWTCESRCGGGYKLRVAALDGSASAESPGTFSIAAAPPSGGGEPDFQLASIDLYFKWKPDNNLGQVLTIMVYASWVNNGADYTGPLKIHYIYLDALQGSKISKDAVLEIPSVSIAHNKGRKDYLCTVENIPDSVESITFGVMIDPDNQVKETNEKNNFADKSTEFPHRPNLVIEDLTLSSQKIWMDEKMRIQFQVRNTGIAPAEHFAVKVYRTFGGHKITIQSWDDITLSDPRKASKNAAVNLTAFLDPWGLPPHSSQIVAEADFLGQIPERNEFDNVAKRQFDVLPTADLAFLKAETRQEIMKLHCDFDVTNKGYIDADNVYVYIFVSAHSTPFGLRKKIAMGTIQKGTHKSSTATIEITWPRGLYYVTFVVDGCCWPGGGHGDMVIHDVNGGDNHVDIKKELE